MASRRCGERDQGETLLELMISITILGICVVSIGAAIAFSVKMSGVHRNQATAAALLHDYAEMLQGSYISCARASDYNTVLNSTPPPAPFNAPTTAVKFWDPGSASFSSGNCPGVDGLQQVTLNLTTSDGLVTESLIVAASKPS